MGPYFAQDADVEQHSREKNGYIVDSVDKAGNNYRKRFSSKQRKFRKKKLPTG